MTADVASLNIGLRALTADISQKIAPEIDRLKTSTEDHTGKLNEVAEELGRLNRNLEILQTGLKRVIGKVAEQERRLDAVTQAKAAPAKSPAPATTSGDDFMSGFDGLFKGMEDVFKNFDGLFKYVSVKKTTKG